MAQEERKTQANKSGEQKTVVLQMCAFSIGNMVIGFVSMHNQIHPILMIALMMSWTLTVLNWPWTKRPAIATGVLLVVCIVSKLLGWKT